MRIIIAIIVSGLLIICPAWASVNSSGAVDYYESFSTRIDGVPGYKYDKFDKNWTYESLYSLNSSGFEFKFLHRVSGKGDKIQLPYIQFVVEEDNEPVIITEVKILIEDTVYHFKDLSPNDNHSYFTLGNYGRSMLEGMAKSKTMSYKLYYYGKSLSFDIDDIDLECPEVKEWALNLEKYGMWGEISTEDMRDADMEYSASVY